MMQIKVVLYASLGRFNPEGRGYKEFTLEVPPGSPVAAVLDLLKIPAEEYKVAFVNNRHRELGEPLEAGDRVALFPPVGGG
jgi:sulfur-carrier protein